MYNENKTISVYIDKENRQEYITCTRFLPKYKLIYMGHNLYYSKEEIMNLPRDKQIETNESNLFYEKSERIFTIDTVGTYLVDFLNTDFGSFDSIKRYVEKYDIYLLNSLCCNKLDLKDLYSLKEYNDVIKLLFNVCSKDMEKIKSNFLQVIDYVYNLYDLKEIEEFTPYERYYTLSNSNLKNTVTQYSSALSLDFNTNINLMSIGESGTKAKYIYEKIYILKNDENITFINCPYFISSNYFSSILYIELVELLSIKDFPLKKCQNCGKYFMPQKRTDEIYCNNIYENNMTCRQIGSKLSRKKRLQVEDSIDRLYRNAYQKRFLRMQRNPDNEIYKSAFEWFKRRAKEIRQEIKDGKSTNEDFKKWLLNVKENERF